MASVHPRRCNSSPTTRSAFSTIYTMWFIYGCIALASPVGLWLARKWVTAGLHAKPATAGDDLG